MRLDLAHAGERGLGHGEEAGDRDQHDDHDHERKVGSRELGQRGSRLLLPEARRRGGRPVVLFEQARSRACIAAASSAVGVVHARARAGCRARRAARARRRSVPAWSGALRAATAGQITTSPSSSGISSGSAIGAVGPRCEPGRAPPSTDESSSIGNASTSVGPSCSMNRWLSSAIDVLVDEQQRQLGVAPDALRRASTASASARPARRRRRRSSDCSSATNTSSAAPRRRRRFDGAADLSGEAGSVTEPPSARS